jgi:hypothetical protein
MPRPDHVTGENLLLSVEHRKSQTIKQFLLFYTSEIIIGVVLQAILSRNEPIQQKNTPILQFEMANQNRVLNAPNAPRSASNAMIALEMRPSWHLTEPYK